MAEEPKASKPDEKPNVTVVLFPSNEAHEENQKLEDNLARASQDPDIRMNLVGVLTDNPETMRFYGVDPAHKHPVAVVVRKFKKTVITGPMDPERLRRIMKGEKS